MKKVLLFIVTVAVIGLGVYAIVKHNPKAETKNENINTTETTTVEQPALPDKLLETDIIFFYGSTCPHCKKVEQFFADYQIDKRVKFEQKEVYNSPDNAQLMTEKQTLCKDLAEADKGGVPFLYSSEKCLVGSDTIINYFKQSAGIN